MSPQQHTDALIDAALDLAQRQAAAYANRDMFARLIADYVAVAQEVPTDLIRRYVDVVDEIAELAR